MSRVAAVHAWEALDSRGRPTVACRVVLDSGATGTALVPSGASAGSHEAVELRDGGERYGGRGVRTAVHHVVTVLADAVRDVAPAGVDEALSAVDTSPGFATVGANAVLAVSLAAARAAAADRGLTLARHLTGDGPLHLPMPMVNVVSGGAHAGRAIDIQDVLVVPHAAGSFTEAIEWAVAVREATGRLAAARGYAGAALTADEGGLGRRAADQPGGARPRDGRHRGGRAHRRRPGRPGDRRRRDPAPRGRPLPPAPRGAGAHRGRADRPRSPAGARRTRSSRSRTRSPRTTGTAGPPRPPRSAAGYSSSATTCSSPTRTGSPRGVRDGVANAVLVKVNQNGLVSGAERVVRDARAAGYRTIVSARSGETEDAWLADLAVGWRAGQIKVGSTHRSERTAKWNRLLEFEALEDTTFAGPWPGSAA